MIMGKKTGGIKTLGSLIVAGMLCYASASAFAQGLTVNSATGSPGGSATFSVKLSTGTASIAGTQNDLAFDDINTPIPSMKTCIVTQTQTCNMDSDCPLVTGSSTVHEFCTVRPDCTVNAAGKQAFFSFLPPDCTGTACTGLRAIVVSLDTTQKPTAIADGTTLYSCTSTPLGSTANAYPLTISNASAGDPDGNVVALANNTNGTITIGSALHCACDCDMNGRTSGSEITKAVLILGGARQLTDCPPADSNHDGRVSGSDITRGVLSLGAGTACVPQ